MFVRLVRTVYSGSSARPSGKPPPPRDHKKFATILLPTAPLLFPAGGGRQSSHVPAIIQKFSAASNELEREERGENWLYLIRTPGIVTGRIRSATGSNPQSRRNFRRATRLAAVFAGQSGGHANYLRGQALFKTWLPGYAEEKSPKGVGVVHVISWMKFLYFEETINLRSALCH